MRRSLELLTLLALLPCCGLTGECDDLNCPQPAIRPADYSSVPSPALTVGPHANATNRTATISADAKTLVVRYQRDGKEVVESWAIGP